MKVAKEYIERDEILSHKWKVRVYDPNDPDPVNEVVSVSTILRIPAADVVEVVRCKDCIHRPSGTGAKHDIKFPDDECPCKCPDTWYSWMPPDDWYCASGKRKDGGQDDV